MTYYSLLVTARWYLSMPYSPDSGQAVDPILDPHIGVPISHYTQYGHGNRYVGPPDSGEAEDSNLAPHIGVPQDHQPDILVIFVATPLGDN